MPSMAELDERLFRAVAESVKKREQRKADRDAFRHRRTYGLSRRHAQKLAHLEKA